MTKIELDEQNKIIGANLYSCIGCLGGTEHAKSSKNGGYSHRMCHSSSTSCTCKPLAAPQLQNLQDVKSRYGAVEHLARETRDCYRKLKEKYTVLLLELQLSIITNGYDETIFYQ